MLLIKLRFDLSLGTFFFNVLFFGVFEILLTKLLSDLVGLWTFLFFIVFDLGVLETLLIKLWLDLVSLIGLGFLFFIVLDFFALITLKELLPKLDCFGNGFAKNLEAFLEIDMSDLESYDCE